MFTRAFFTRRVRVGLVLIYLSGFGWIAEIIIPFTKLPTETKAGLFFAAAVISEIVFFGGIAIMGKPTYQAIKAEVTAIIKRRTKKSEPQD